VCGHTAGHLFVSSNCADTFELPPHVYACRTPEGIVFLDTKHDRYFGLSGKKADAIAALVHNWPGGTGAHADPTPVSADELQEMVRTLIERGLLIRRSTDTARRARISVPLLNMVEPALRTDKCRGTRLLDLIYFVVACSRAAWVLKCKSLESIELEMSSVRTRHRCPPRPRDTALELTQIFRDLRRFLFSEKNRCLFNALSLMYFLRAYGHFPMWVIGVRTAPFCAHSWVQEGQTVLDGDPAIICHFVPILAA